MRKLTLIMTVIGLSIMILGFSGKLPSPVEGVYPLKLKTLTLFDLDPKNLPLFWNSAELTDSKPDSIEVDGVDYQDFSEVKFGFFRLGNSEIKVWFLMARNNSNFWNEVYIDENLDFKITKKERVKSFQTNQGRQFGAVALEAFSMIPVSVRVAYKGITKEYTQDLYFFISTLSFTKKEATDVIARVADASFLEGDLRVDNGKEKRLVKFRVLDADSNGCFNDYGKDVIFMDLNQDGYFQKSESQKMAEFFDSAGNEKERKQLRLNLLPFSLKLAVTGVTDEFDLAQLEPESPPEKEVKEGQAPADDNPDPGRNNQAEPDKSGE